MRSCSQFSNKQAQNNQKITNVMTKIVFDSEDELQMKRHAKILSDISLIAAGYIHFLTGNVWSFPRSKMVELHYIFHQLIIYRTSCLLNKPRPVRHFKNYFAIIVLIRRKQLLVDLLLKIDFFSCSSKQGVRLNLRFPILRRVFSKHRLPV